MATQLQEALMEADRQAQHEGVVWRTLRQITGELDRLGISHVVVGGIALQHHGIQRSTQDVDVLIDSQAELDRLHEALVGHGYTRKGPQSRHLRDDVTRIRVEFLVAGEFPGDGQPKPVAFPMPATVSERSEEGIAFIRVAKLIELKLASAKSAPHRIKDQADVLELIHKLKLTRDFATQLNEYVRDEFVRLSELPPPSEPDD